MRNLKKFLAVVLAIAIMATTMVPALAAEAYTYEEAAEILYDLGLIAGDGVDFALGRALTRAEGITIVLKLFGYQEEADSITDEEIDEALAGFADTDLVKASWAKGWLAIGVREGLVSGTTDGRIDPNGPFTGKQLAALILKMMGKELTLEMYNNACVELANIGGLNPAEVLFNDIQLNRDKAFGMMFAALNAKYDDGTTIIENLIYMGVVDEDKAAEYGLIEVAEIVDVEDVAVKVKVGEEPALPDEVEVTFSDGTTKMVPVVWGDVDTSVAGEFEVEGVLEGYDRIVIATVTVEDVPFEVVSVTADNLKEIVVNFNKALDKDTAQNKDNYTVSAGGPVVSATVSGQSVVLKLTSDSIAQQTTIDVTIQNVKDAAGNTIAKTTKSVQLVDTTVPSVVSVTVTGPRTLEVVFSEPLKSVPTFKIDKGTYYAAPTFAMGDKVITLTLGVTLSEGTHSVTISGGADYAGYKVPETTIEYVYAKDTTVPVVSVESATETKVTLKFSKKVKATNLNTDVTAYYSYNNDAAYKGTLAAVNPDSDGYSDTYTATFTTPIPSGTHTFYLNTKADKLEDKWGNDVASVELAITVVVDNVKPTVVSVTPDGDKKIKVTFSEDVQSTDATNKSYYTLKDAAGNVIKTSAYPDVDNNGHFNANATITYADKVATITLTNPLPGGDYYLTIEKIRDTAYIKNTMDAVTIGFTVTDKTPPSLSLAYINAAGTKIRVVFNEAMSTEGLTNPANYRLVVNDSTSQSLPGNSTVSIVDTKTVEISMPVAVSGLDGANDKIQVSGTLKDISGNAIGGFFTEISLGTDALNYVANSAKATAKNTITFEVDKELSAIDVNKFSITSSTAGLAVGSVYYVNDSGKAVVTVVLNGNLKTDLSDLTELSVAAEGLTNVFGTKNAAFNITTIADKIAPEVVSVEAISTTQIKITFSEAINPATVSIYTFAVTDNTVTAISWDGAYKVLTLTLKDAIATDATPAVVQALDLTDSDGNKLASGSSVPSTADKIAPTVVTKGGNADDNPDKIDAGAYFTIEFSEELHGDSKTAVQNAFTSISAGFTFTWVGKVLTVTNSTTSAITISQDVSVTLKDVNGNQTPSDVLVYEY